MEQYKINLKTDPLNGGFSEASRVCDAAIMLGYKTCILRLSDANLVIASVDEFKLFEDKLSDLTEISEDDFISMVAAQCQQPDPHNDETEYLLSSQGNKERLESSIKQLRDNDTVNHPNHYTSSAIECIDAMEAMLTHEQFIGFLRGNIFKYQWRYEKKNGLEDLDKSQWYLGKLMEKLNEKEAQFD